MKKLNYNDVADYFIAFAYSVGESITNLKIQKLIYYAQAWHLAIYEKPIFNAEIEAWVHGPVVPELYRALKIHGHHDIRREDFTECTATELYGRFGDSVKRVVDIVCEDYFSLSAYALERKTHKEMPWMLARSGVPEKQPSRSVITKESMQSYYGKFVLSKEDEAAIRDADAEYERGEYIVWTPGYFA